MAVRLEIETTKHWMIRPEFVHAMRRRIRNGETAFLDAAAEDKVLGCRVPVSAVADVFKDVHYSAIDGRYISSYKEDRVDEPYINVMYVLGPITRNGDACSYGSVDHRNMMMRSADDARCVGHVFYIDTPGGSAWAKNDYQQAIAYARSKQQPVVAFIDGMCASAGMYLASMCDSRYYMHPKDEVGCIGVMAAFYTVADGSKNQFTDETYHEIYADGSTFKNKEYRDIANDGNDELFKQELNELNDEFIADMHAAFPNATDDMLTGKMYKAGRVEGIFLDGQSTLGEVFGMVVERSAANGVPAGVQAWEQLNPTATPDGENENGGDNGDGNNVNNQHKAAENMNSKYKTVAEYCGVDELVVTNEGTHLDVSLVDTLQHNIDEGRTQLAERDTQIAALQKEVDDLKAASANAEQLSQTVAERDKTIEQLNAQIAELQKQADETKKQLDVANQTIADRDSTIAELTQKPGDAPDAGESPKNNGTGVAVPHMAQIVPQYDATKSPLENKRIREEFEQKRKEQLNIR